MTDETAAVQRPCPACGRAIDLPTRGPVHCPSCGWHRAGDMRIIAIPMDGVKHSYRLADALQAVRALVDLVDYEGTGIVPPNKNAVLRAQSLVLAVGPFTPEGPQRITLTASIKGGVTVTFFGPDGLYVVVACMNNAKTIFFLCEHAGSEPNPEDVSFEDAVERTRGLVGCDYGSISQPLRPHASAD